MTGLVAVAPEDQGDMAEATKGKVAVDIEAGGRLYTIHWGIGLQRAAFALAFTDYGFRSLQKQGLLPCTMPALTLDGVWLNQ